MAKEVAFRAFSVIDRGEGQEPYWLAIGAAFEHVAGPESGYNLLLQALPLPGPDGQCKIVLRPPKDEAADRRAAEELRGPNRKSGQVRR
jgi:hypothetical protein